MRWVLVVLVVLLGACGGAPPRPSPAPPVPTAPVGRHAKPTPELTAEVFCDRLTRLALTCPAFASFHMDPATCVDEMRADLAARDDQRRATALEGCVIEHDDCREVVACLATTQPDPTEPDTLRACDDASRKVSEHAVGIPRAAWEQRYGVQVTSFHAASSSRARPIEMCGVPAATDWLTSLRCDDGSQPIRDVNDAEAARPGNVGAGGRCRSIIDRYVIPCPEASYEIFIDAYICPLP